MAKDYTQMGLAERRTIEESLRKGLSLGRIAETIGRSKSTVSREILSNRTTEAPKGRMAACMMRRDCVLSCVCGEEWCVSPGESCSFCKERDCRRFCETFRAGGRACDRLEHPPYVCDGCRYQSGCSVRARWYYSAATADATSKERRSRSRRGIDMEPVRAALVLDQVRDAIGRGMSPYAVSVAYAGSIGVSPSTIYRWVERGYAGMANIDLERKVGFRRRKGGSRHRATAHSRRRRYEAFCALGEDVHAAAVEMDTVMGHVNSNPRKSLCGMSPIEMFVAAYGQDAEALLEGLGMERVVPEELVLKPALVNAERRKRGEEELAALP